ncbi:hypothetical protein [Pantanalinema sp. GBBB05]|uniref:hypothetical protein n=1 Tax=Pantanalinema sp. GBBB05 TaxID=2604139 RepID=UPI001D512F0D|nr:hypothetical protein [Pantanalinema sp. GBBB05]
MAHEFKTVIPELNNASIRRTPDGRSSVYDLIAVIGEQKNPYQAWDRIVERFPEVLTKCEDFKFPGKRQRKTPVTDRAGWAYIIGLLPGVMGHKYREASANLVLRYLDADITLAADVVERNDNQRELEWLDARVRGKITRKKFTGILKSHKVFGSGYAICTNRTYIGLFGTTAEGMRKRKGLSKKANWRDHASTSELNTIAFTEDLSGQKIDGVNARGNSECSDVCFSVALKVADFTKEILRA